MSSKTDTCYVQRVDIVGKFWEDLEAYPFHSRGLIIDTWINSAVYNFRYMKSVESSLRNSRAE